jgi:putative FmdB family regulatory protein
MPIYDFSCQACGHRFEELTASGDQPACPECGAPGAERLFSPFAGSQRFGLRGAEATRSQDAQRKRSEQRKQRSDRQREQRRQHGS